MAALLTKLKEMVAPGQGSIRQTDHKPERQVAVCALLLEVAEADSHFDPVERQTIVNLLQSHFGLAQGEVEGLIADTQAQRDRSADLWPFTHAIRLHFSPEEKLELLEMVWRVIFADGTLDPHEDMLAHRMERMLAVNHSLIMEAKARARGKTRPV